MAKKTSRLNDTVALAAIPFDSLNRSESRSTSVRRISNGFVTCHTSNKDGRYESTESFSETPPELGDVAQENPMARAKAYLEREGTA